MSIQIEKRAYLVLVVLLCVYIVFSNFNFRISPELSYDVLGYYLYLPFTFIYGDLGMENFDVFQTLNDTYHNTPFFYQGHRAETGLMVMKYTMGQSILYAPFFFIGHVIASLTDYPADGFSAPYSWSIFVGGIFYTLTGILLFSRILIRFFHVRIAALVLLIVCFGTNFIVHNIMYSQNAMTHNYLFMMYTLVLWLTIKWHEKQSWKTTIALGIVCGLTILIRPTEIVNLFIPLLWNIWKKESFKAKIQLIKENKIKVLTILILAICIPSLQLIYFKIFTGVYFYSDYSNHAGEGLDLFAPYTLEVLFSFRKGWLLYTPIMIFALIGFRSLYLRNRKIFWPLFIYFVFNLWFVSSWTCWWYAGSFSQRAMIPSYIVLGICLGYFLVWLFEQKKRLILALSVVIVSLFALNIFQTVQFHKGILAPDRITAAFYFKIFGSLERHPEDEKLLSVNTGDLRIAHHIDTSEFKLTKVFREDFEQLNTHYSSFSYKGKKAERLSNKHDFSIGLSKPFGEITEKDYAWVRISAWVYTEADSREQDFLLAAFADHKGKAYVWEAKEAQEFKVPKGKWTKITFNYMTPPIRRKFNEIKSYIWLKNDKPLLVDDYKFEIFEPK